MIRPHRAPPATAICRRLAETSVNTINDRMTAAAADGRASRTVYAIDTTGIKVDNRSEWMRKKWKAGRGFIKMRAPAGTRTGMIVAARITDESVGDSKGIYLS